MLSAITAAGMTRLTNIDLGDDFESFIRSYLMSSDRVAFLETHHPRLNMDLLHPATKHVVVKRRVGADWQPVKDFGESGCRFLARALSLNTCITSLDLHNTKIGPAGAELLFPALTHLTAMTFINLCGTDLQSSGAAHLCSALPHLTALTHLDVSQNQLTADDGALLCSAAAAAGMTRLENLKLEIDAHSIVGCDTWRLFNLPQPPDVFLDRDRCFKVNIFSENSAALVQYLMKSHKGGFLHPDLPPELLQRIETTDPTLTRLSFGTETRLGRKGCRILARALPVCSALLRSVSRIFVMWWNKVAVSAACTAISASRSLVYCASRAPTLGCSSLLPRAQMKYWTPAVLALVFSVG
jgi:hypothetical protein